VTSWLSQRLSSGTVKEQNDPLLGARARFPRLDGERRALPHVTHVDATLRSRYDGAPWVERGAAVVSPLPRVIEAPQPGL
jgi:hypothetical protein